MTLDRFYLLDAGASRPTRVPLPPWATVKAGVADTQGRFSLMENRGDGSIPPHVHDHFDEFVYVVDGELEIDFDGAAHHLTAGMCALVPRGSPTRCVTSEARCTRCSSRHRAGGSATWKTSPRPASAGTGPRPTKIGKPYGMRYHLGEGDADEWGDKGRFVLLAAGQARPGRIAVPPAFSVKARTTDTDGLFSLLEVTVAQPVPRHTHHVADECIYVLSGELTIEFDDRVHTASAGAFVLLPHGVPHAIRPGSTPPPRVIQISSPGGWECVVEALIEHRTEVSRTGTFDPAALNRYTRRYHVVYEETR